MKNLLLISLFSLLSGLVYAQKAPPAEKSDPEAKKILDKIRRKYEGYKTLEAAFSLSIELPGQPKEVQKGTVSQDGNKFRLDMDQQVLVSDGKTTWAYLKKNKEVQISNADPGAMGSSDFMTPKELLRRYEKGDFLYALTDKITENGKLLTQIEFKPKDKKSEYAKMRLSIDEKTGTIDNIKAFGKDGSRFTFKIVRLTPNKVFTASTFSFDPKQYPGVRVEDLRM
jgi:outer membrane lipoprotein carrier protein